MMDRPDTQKDLPTNLQLSLCYNVRFQRQRHSLPPAPWKTKMTQIVTEVWKMTCYNLAAYGHPYCHSTPSIQEQISAEISVPMQLLATVLKN